jgi:hypothetical protein
MKKTLVFCLEEPSAKAMLEGILPRLLPEQIEARFIIFEGKQDLHKQLVRRLRFWQKPDSYFVVIRDQDHADCRQVKQALVALCQQADRANSLVRIACHELESFYLGDLAAVEIGLELKGLAKRQTIKKFRTPDKLENAAEELEKITQHSYQKLSGSKRISPHLKLDGSNTSKSFAMLVCGIQRICWEIDA